MNISLPLIIYRTINQHYRLKLYAAEYRKSIRQSLNKRLH